MTTYKAVMRPLCLFHTVASCILDQHKQTVSHAERSIENCHKMHTNTQHLHDETLTLPIHDHLQLHASQYKQKTQHPSHPLYKHTTYFQHSKAKKHYFQQQPLHNKHSHRPSHNHNNRHKNKHVPYTYIYCL